MLCTATQTCCGFASLMRASLAKHPPDYDKPWGLIIYSDEFVPGNQLSFHNLRKIWVLYYSFKEFGACILSMEDAWFCLCVVTSDHVKEIKGGMAQVFSAVLEHMFSSTSHNMRHSGVKLDFPDDHVMPSARCRVSWATSPPGSSASQFSSSLFQPSSPGVTTESARPNTFWVKGVFFHSGLFTASSSSSDHSSA